MNYRRIRIVRVGLDKTIDFAAKELARYMKAACPELVVDEMVSMEVPEDQSGVIVLKVCPHLPIKLGVANPKLDDGIRIRIKNDQGWIAGTNPRSVLIGVYRFLREMGFAFTRPGKDGDRIPCCLKEEYEVDILDKPAYRHRGITIEGADTYQNILDVIDWIPKNGMNEYFVQFWVPGTFFTRWYGHASNPYLEEEKLTMDDVKGFVISLEEEISRRGIHYHKTGHGWTCEPFGVEGTNWDTDHVYEVPEKTKEYFALVNGKRDLFGNIPLNTNLCYSNPEVRSKITDAIRDYCLVNKQVNVIHFWLADGHDNHCECDECVKKIPTDWYVMMLNELDEKLTAAGVDTKIVFLIYHELLWAPQTEEIKNPDRYILMFAPISRLYGRNYADYATFDGELSPYIRNAIKEPRQLDGYLEMLRRWQQHFQGDSFIFDYHLQWAHSSDPGYELAAKNIFEDMVYLKEMGLNGNVSCQVNRCYFPSAIVSYALAEALWNRDQKFEDVITRYYAAVYGKEGAKVQAYLSEISHQFTVYPNYKTPGNGKYIKDYDRVVALVDEFAPVIEAGIAKNGQCAADWKNLKIHAEYVKLLAKVMKLTDEGKEEEAAAAIEAVVDYLNFHELDIQEVMDGDNYARLLRNHFQGSF